jgi:DNA-binding HxlR family transcriptional regulator
MAERPLTKKQKAALIMMPGVYRWTQGSLPSLERRGLVERYRHTEYGRSYVDWRLTEAGAEMSDTLRAASRAEREATRA